MSARHVALKLAYDGTAFSGFQRQPGLRTVQGVLEEALARLTKEACPVKGAGRTDAGVHAEGQVVSFRTISSIPTSRLVPALNGLLPPDVAVLAAAEVPEQFHPRYDAVSKVYRYTFFRRAVRCPLTRFYALHVPEPLDVERMREAAAYLVGRHDFRAFQNTGRPVTSSVRTVFSCRLEEAGPFLYLWIEADGFLYQMVRIIAGTLLEIGKGRFSSEVVKRALVEGRRELLGPTAPPHGLCLMRVRYPRDPFGEDDAPCR
ncbi:tRNA pseudouridine(38-40) synthase TruA [Ammonifex thiophilus]|uniref:tRNA pseudouridine synthase A n=1 Tax=Ammonifex thiophilus TaxID=444093 RepID=A0A3D8P5P6_9THEO|nr:tRNA pseudouridine(38-40) synthase TruA [Ammonifex thiophilus]RDV83390.1 tRNA pseudouridine(38-40) synthase TruA [Ammonifex thiophilus]